MIEYSGHENLRTMAESHNFNNWMYNEIFPGLKGDILEVGSGLGVFSEKIINDFPNSKISLSEISSSYINDLREKFHQKNVSIYRLDLNSKDDFEKIGFEKFDSIFALNVLEHVEKDSFALKQLYKMLKPDGNLIILVPCHKFLYNVIDRQVGHFRRYTKKELKLKITSSNFKILKIFYFNILGIPGWYINGNILHNPTVNNSATKLFNRIVPVERIIEKIMNKSVGLSLICYAKKTQNDLPKKFLEF